MACPCMQIKDWQDLIAISCLSYVNKCRMRKRTRRDDTIPNNQNTPKAGFLRYPGHGSPSRALHNLLVDVRSKEIPEYDTVGGGSG